MMPIGDEKSPRTFPIINYTIIAINIVVFAYFIIVGELEKAVKVYGLIPLFVLKGERLYTIFTSMFMHGGFLHIFGNMLYLYIFGDNVEDAFGHFRYLVFYFISGIGATSFNLLSIILFGSPTSYLIPTIGASGAISGVLGAYLYLYPRNRVRVLVIYWLITIIYLPAVIFIGFWFIYQLFMSFWSLVGFGTDIAWFAHIGGFITGLTLAKAFKKKRVRRAPRIYQIVYKVPVK